MVIPEFPGAPKIGRYSFLEPCLLLRVAGQGGMGMVYEAYDTLRSRKVAVKVSSNPVGSPRFYLEAVLGISDLGEHVIQVLDIRRFQGTDYILMEWVEGGDLHSFTKEGVLTSGQIIGVARQVCDGLGRIHDKGIIHRDIKPANLMVTYEGVVKLADLGIAQSQEALHMATVGPIGTRVFMAPEQREGLKADERSDIYSVGVTLYMLATGLMQRERSGELQRMLVEGLRPIEELVPDMHPDLVKVITRASEHAPEVRFQSTKELDEALAAIDLTPEPVLPERKTLETTLPSKDIIRQAREFRNQLGGDGPEEAHPTALVDESLVPGEAESAPGTNPWGKRLAGALVLLGLIGLGAVAILKDKEPPQEELQAAAESEDKDLGPGLLVDTSTGAEEVATQGTELAKADEPPAAQQAAPLEEAPEQLAEVKSSPVPTPPEPRLPALDGFQVHTDVADRVAYVPELNLELGPKLERKLRFVDLNLKGYPGMLVQEMEVARELAFHAGVIEKNPGTDRCLPWEGINLELAKKLVTRLNELRPEGANYRFLIPTVEQRKSLEALEQFCTLSLDSTKQKSVKTPTGEAPKLREARTTPSKRSVYDPEGWYPSRETGLYGVVGNIAELCLSEEPNIVEYRGGADLDRRNGDISVSRGVRTKFSFRQETHGLRLFLQLDTR